MQLLAQGAAGVLLVHLGPQEGQQRDAAVEAAGGGNGEVGQECGPLGGRKDHAQFTPPGIVEIQAPQRPKLDHGAERKSINVNSFCDVTLRSPPCHCHRLNCDRDSVKSYGWGRDGAISAEA